MGEIDDAQTSHILNDVEQRLKHLNPQPKTLKKTLNIIIEVAQNLYHHGIVPNDFNNKYTNLGVIIVSKQENGYKIVTGNFVKSSDVAHIKRRIEQVNALSQKETKELFRNTLNNDTFSSKGGGGLGFMDIARKSKNKLNFQFYDYKEGYLFFTLDITIKNT